MRPSFITIGNRKGFYINGPDFFIVPNKIWDVDQRTRKFIILASKVGGPTIKIDRKYLVNAIREPADCAYTPIPEPHHLVLSIPNLPTDKLPASLQEYIRFTDNLIGERISAKKYAPKRLYWYSMLWKSLESPFGPIAIPRKFRPYGRGVAAHYIPSNETEDSGDNIAVPMTFYTRSTGESLKNRAMVSYLNSTPALAFRYRERSWLGRASEEMNGDQIDAMKVINVDSLSNDALVGLAECRFMSNKSVPDFSAQMMDPHYKETGRLELDDLVLRILGVPESELRRIRQECVSIVLKWIEGIKLMATSSS